jgi:arginine-tRNA-protein transferase
MDYKTRFQPQEHLTPRGWERFDPSSMRESNQD